MSRFSTRLNQMLTRIVILSLLLSAMGVPVRVVDRQAATPVEAAVDPIPLTFGIMKQEAAVALSDEEISPARAWC